jgi:hypothetical protein
MRSTKITGKSDYSWPCGVPVSQYSHNLITTRKRIQANFREKCESPVPERISEVGAELTYP